MERAIPKDVIVGAIIRVPVLQQGGSGGSPARQRRDQSSVHRGGMHANLLQHDVGEDTSTAGARGYLR
jgi:hypothetical protein